MLGIIEAPPTDEPSTPAEAWKLIARRLGEIDARLDRIQNQGSNG